MAVARPRSRTSWLATFLNAGGAVCQHDIIDICPGPAAYRDALDIAEISGAVDTGAVLVLPEILAHVPECKVVVIDRPQGDCEADMFRATGMHVDMEVYNAPMQAAVMLPEALVVKFEHLDDEETIRTIWDHLVGEPFPHVWYEHCRWMDIQPSKKFFNTEFVRRANNPGLFDGWALDSLFNGGLPA